MRVKHVTADAFSFEKRLQEALDELTKQNITFIDIKYSIGQKDAISGMSNTNTHGALIMYKH